MVKLTEEQQSEFVQTQPGVFKPASGAWGRQGCTMVYLRTAKKASVLKALRNTYHNIASKNTKPKKRP